MKRVIFEGLVLAAILGCIVGPVLAQNSAKPDWKESFRAHDKNGDGRLRLQEFLNAVFKDFEVADINKKGALTMEEIDAYIKRAGK
jgi:Ca2+-binding EF-hand superfamily protein